MVERKVHPRQNIERIQTLSTELKPDAVVYSIDQKGMSKTKELTCLLLILPTSSGYYVYLDFPKNNALKKTGIPIREDKRGNRYLQDEKQFSKNAFGRARKAAARRLLWKLLQQ